MFSKPDKIGVKLNQAPCLNAQIFNAGKTDTFPDPGIIGIATSVSYQ
jgi:hypothetical protein